MNKHLNLMKIIFLFFLLSFTLIANQNCSPNFKSASIDNSVDLASLPLANNDGSTSGAVPTAEDKYLLAFPENEDGRFKAALAVMSNKCISCHYVGSQPGPISFPTVQEFVAEKLIVPGSLSQSKLIHRLRQYPANVLGKTMPPSGAKDLTVREYLALAKWVENLPIESTTVKNPFACSPDEAPLKMDSVKLSKMELYNTLFGLLSRSFGDGTTNVILNSNQDVFWTRVPSDVKVPFSVSDRNVNANHARAYFNLADDISKAVTAADRINQFVSTYINYKNTGCETINMNQLSNICLEVFTKNFVLRAWGRPIDSTNDNNNNELASYVKIFSVGASTAEKISNIVFRTLLSPSFINHLYIDTELQPSQVALLTNYAIARKLSFQYMKKNIDEELIKITQNNDLRTDTGFSIAVNYVIGKSSSMVNEFSNEWLRLDNISALSTNATEKYKMITKDLKLDESVRASMKSEITDLMDYVYKSGRPVKEILTTDISFAKNTELLKIYGLSQPSPAAVDEQNAIRFDKSQGRSGVPSRAAFLLSGSDTERPIDRAIKIRTIFLCQEVKGSPPPNAASSPLPEGIFTIRDKVHQLTSSANCIGCHSQINPSGFAFSEFNAVGVHQLNEPVFQSNKFIQNLRVSAQVDLLPVFGLAGSTSTAAEFNTQISESNDFKTCMSQYYFTYLNRSQSLSKSLNSCDMKRLYDTIDTNGSLQEFFKAPILNPKFKQRKVN